MVEWFWNALGGSIISYNYYFLPSESKTTIQFKIKIKIQV